MSQVEQFNEYRPLLFSIAYRMLGSVMEAEDMVQETFLRWLEAKEVEVKSPKSYLLSRQWRNFPKRAGLLKRKNYELSGVFGAPSILRLA
jgi:DNA-directed RNA polymerase specialized sigma24 family protein